jgi:FHA domain
MKCTNGHDSAAADYCDQCGVKIDGPGSSSIGPVGSVGSVASVAASVGPASSATPTPAFESPAVPASPKAAGFDVATTAGTCPNCNGVKDGFSIFCEDCGYDFVTGIVPPNRTGAPGVAAGASGSSSSSSSSATAPSVSTSPGATVINEAGSWMIVVATDRAQFDRVGDSTVVFPVGVADRVVELTADRALIGRKSTSRNIHPEVDLSPTPEDVAVSRQHAEIVRAADGTFTVSDLGSSNGTFLNGSAAAMAPNTPMPLANGDSISVGAWTTLTLVLP